MSAPRQTPVRVYVTLALGLLSISVSAILVRLASEGPGLAIATWRTTFAVCLLVPLVAVQLRRRGHQPLDARHWRLTALAAALLALHFVLWIESLYHTSVASASVLVSTTPIFLALFGFLFFKEKAAALTLVAVGLGVLGAYLISSGNVGSAISGDARLGNSLALSASAAFALYLLVGRVVRRLLEWLSYVFPLFAIVAVSVWITALLRGIPLFGYSAGFYGLCLAMAVGPQIFGHGSFNYALRYLSPTLVGLLILLEPVIASVLANLLFDELPGPIAILGMALVLISIALAVLGERARPEVEGPG